MSSRIHRDSRSQSPPRGESDRTHRSRRDSREDARHGVRDIQKSLPYNARQLTKHDLDFYRPMFSLYLDIQKRIDIEDIAPEEVKGRWKSFFNKWNRGDLAEGWYDPATLTKARNAHEKPVGSLHEDKIRSNREHDWKHKQTDEDIHEHDEDDYGPTPPKPLDTQLNTQSRSSTKDLRAGPTIPSYQDLQSRNEEARVSAETAREKHIETIKHERKLDRKLQKSELDEIAPRAEAGTRERQLEKKKEIADSNRAFAASKEVGGDVEIRDSDLMGGDDLGELKRMKKEQDRRKTEREIRREEVLRARMAERGQKLKAIRDKEEKTMSMLREIAQERFGGGNEQHATLREED